MSKIIKRKEEEEESTSVKVETRRRKTRGRRVNNRVLAVVESYKNLKHLSLSQFSSRFDRVDMSWTCSVCEEDFSRKDNMQRHMSSKHTVSRCFTPLKAMPFSPEKCPQFQFDLHIHLLAWLQG